MQMLVCEKPKVARTMAKALADDKVNNKKLYGINYYEIEHNKRPIIVVSAVGHIYSLIESHPTRKYPSFDIEWKPAYKVNRRQAYTKSYVKLIEKMSSKVDEVVSACDYDIEGSLIAWNVIRFACGKDKAKRMKFSALTPKDLHEAYDNMSGLDQGNCYAGEARHKMDWFYGINLSRALMTSVMKNGMRKTMSIGRVQGPALAIVAKRELKIKKFKPEPYWELYAINNKIKFMHETNRFTSKDKFEEINNKIKNEKEAVVDSITKRKSKKRPYPPFDLTSLQIEAYKQFKFPPARTLAYAQTLYEASMISYPRTSSQKLPAKLGHKNILKQLAKNSNYSKLANKLLNENKIKPKEGRKADKAHPAIHPLGKMGKMGAREMKLYDLIVKRYLACFADYAIRESQKVVLDVKNEKFKASGKRTVEPGWMDFYGKYTKLKEQEFPEYIKGNKVPVKINSDKKMTKPPKRFTPASLISALEKKNLGTKATRSSIVETLFNRGYLDGKSINVTDFGIGVYKTLKKHCPEILDHKLTRQFEKDMEEIIDGKINEEIVIAKGKEQLKEILSKYKKHEREIGRELVNLLKGDQIKKLGKCPNCEDGDLVTVVSPRSGKQYVACNNYPKCRTTYPLPQKALIEPTDRTCNYCKTPIFKVIRKGRRPYEMCLDPKCKSKANWTKSYSKKKSKYKKSKKKSKK